MFKRCANLFSSSPGRMLRFLFNNTCRPYLKDELKQDQFELSLWDGTGTIDNIELNEEVIFIVPFSGCLYF
jgi:hypothetical protein